MNKKYKNNLYTFIIKTFLVIIITLIVLILSKASPSIKEKINKYVFLDTFDFNKYMNKYTKYFNEFFPFENLFKEEKVFNEKLEYKSVSKYLNGVSLEVESNYLVPTINSGLVVFIGEKENYGNVVIVQQVDGVDMWYGNLLNNAVDLYDYVEKGTLLGEANNNLYLVLEKEGTYLNYEEY